MVQRKYTGGRGRRWGSTECTSEASKICRGGHCCTGGSGPQRGSFIGEAVGGREREREDSPIRARTAPGRGSGEGRDGGKRLRFRRRVDEIPPLSAMGFFPEKRRIFRGKRRDRSRLSVGALLPVSADDLAIHVDPAVHGDFFAVGTSGSSPCRARPGLGLSAFAASAVAAASAS